MNKAELINAAAEKAGLSKKDTEAAITAAIAVITENLAQDEKVQLVGFGSFEVKSRAERIGRNPKTKEQIKIPASKMPVFKAGKALKDAVAKYFDIVKAGTGNRFPLFAERTYYATGQMAESIPPDQAAHGGQRGL